MDGWKKGGRPSFLMEISFARLFPSFASLAFFLKVYFVSLLFFIFVFAYSLERAASHCRRMKFLHDDLMMRALTHTHTHTHSHECGSFLFSSFVRWDVCVCVGSSEMDKDEVEAGEQ